MPSGERAPFLIRGIVVVLTTLLGTTLLSAQPQREDVPKQTTSATAEEAIRKIEGVYKERFANSTVQDEHYVSEDILEIVPYDRDKIYFAVSAIDDYVL